eukprot:scaffold16424_cov107-Isochrysis_galbana.AAC.4
MGARAAGASSGQLLAMLVTCHTARALNCTEQQCRTGDGWLTLSPRCRGLCQALKAQCSVLLGGGALNIE